MIQNIKKQLLQDTTLYDEFESMIPNGVGADVLWKLLVDRIANLHGTELASEIMESLAALKRKSSGAKQRLNPDKRTVAAKYEQLRVAKKRKKIERVRAHNSCIRVHSCTHNHTNAGCGCSGHDSSRGGKPCVLMCARTLMHAHTNAGCGLDNDSSREGNLRVCHRSGSHCN